TANNRLFIFESFLLHRRHLLRDAFFRRVRSALQEISVVPSIPHHNFAYSHLNRPSENRTIINERMKLAVLAARVDSGRQIVEKLRIISPPHETSADSSLNARKISFKSRADHLSSERGRGALPDWKDSAHPHFREIRFAPFPAILQKQIAEPDR